MDDNRSSATIRDYMRSVARTKEVWAWLFRLADSKLWRKWMITRYLSMILRQAASLAQPGVLGVLIAEATQGHTDKLFPLAVTLAALVLTNQLFTLGSGHAHEWLWGLNLKATYVGIFKRFVAKSPRQHVEMRELQQEAIDRAGNCAHDLLAHKLPDLCETLTIIFFGWAGMVYMCPAAGLALSAPIAVHVAIMLYLNWKADIEASSIDKDIRALGRYRTARLENVLRVITAGKRQEEAETINAMCEDVAIRDRDHWQWHSRVASLRDGLVSFGILGIFVYALHMVSTRGWKDAGLLVPIWIWGTVVRDKLQVLGWIERETLKQIPKVRAMAEALDTPPDVKDAVGAITLPKGRAASLVLEGVTHSYPRGIPVLRDVSFEVNQGEIVAVIGPSGTGKSTLAGLIMRFMDPEDGRVLIDGIDLRGIALDSWMRKVGYIPQQAQVLDGTVRYNLSYGLTRAELASRDWEPVLSRALEQLHIDFGARPPGENPLDILVGKDGVQLSGGQRQRLMIGAAVLQGPDFLVIDEATSSLDSTTEKAVLAGLDEQLGGKGVLVIAHRLSTVRRANKIVVLSGGRIEAIAKNFEELYDLSPTFRNMADDQNLEID